MSAFEQLLGRFVAAVILAAIARRVGALYPVFLALGGVVLAFVPGSPAELRRNRCRPCGVHRLQQFIR